MAPEDQESPEPEQPEELHNEDFQAVLKALLAAYQPVVEEELRLRHAAGMVRQQANDQ